MSISSIIKENNSNVKYEQKKINCSKSLTGDKCCNSSFSVPLLSSHVSPSFSFSSFSLESKYSVISPNSVPLPHALSSFILPPDSLSSPVASQTFFSSLASCYSSCSSSYVSCPEVSTLTSQSSFSYKPSFSKEKIHPTSLHRYSLLVIILLCALSITTHVWRQSLSTFHVYFMKDAALHYTDSIHSIIINLYNLTAAVAAVIAGCIFHKEHCAKQVLCAILIEWISQIIFSVCIAIDNLLLACIAQIIGGFGGGCVVVYQRTLLSILFFKDTTYAMSFTVAISAIAKTFGKIIPVPLTLYLRSYKIALFASVLFNLIPVCAAVYFMSNLDEIVEECCSSNNNTNFLKSAADENIEKVKAESEKTNLYLEDRKVNLKEGKSEGKKQEKENRNNKKIEKGYKHQIFDGGAPQDEKLEMKRAKSARKKRNKFDKERGKSKCSMMNRENINKEEHNGIQAEQKNKRLLHCQDADFFSHSEPSKHVVAAVETDGLSGRDSSKRHSKMSNSSILSSLSSKVWKKVIGGEETEVDSKGFFEEDRKVIFNFKKSAEEKDKMRNIEEEEEYRSTLDGKMYKKYIPPKLGSSSFLNFCALKSFKVSDEGKEEEIYDYRYERNAPYDDRNFNCFYDSRNIKQNIEKAATHQGKDSLKKERRYAIRAESRCAISHVEERGKILSFFETCLNRYKAYFLGSAQKKSIRKDEDSLLSKGKRERKKCSQKHKVLRFSMKYIYDNDNYYNNDNNNADLTAGSTNETMAFFKRDKKHSDTLKPYEVRVNLTDSIDENLDMQKIFNEQSEEKTTNYVACSDSLNKDQNLKNKLDANSTREICKQEVSACNEENNRSKQEQEEQEQEGKDKCVLLKDNDSLSFSCSNCHFSKNFIFPSLSSSEFNLPCCASSSSFSSSSYQSCISQDYSHLLSFYTQNSLTFIANTNEPEEMNTKSMLSSTSSTSFFEKKLAADEKGSLHEIKANDVALTSENNNNNNTANANPGSDAAEEDNVTFYSASQATKFDKTSTSIKSKNTLNLPDPDSMSTIFMKRKKYPREIEEAEFNDYQEFEDYQLCNDYAYPSCYNNKIGVIKHNNSRRFRKRIRGSLCFNNFIENKLPAIIKKVKYLSSDFWFLALLHGLYLSVFHTFLNYSNDIFLHFFTSNPAYAALISAAVTGIMVITLPIVGYFVDKIGYGLILVMIGALLAWISLVGTIYTRNIYTYSNNMHLYNAHKNKIHSSDCSENIISNDNSSIMSNFSQSIFNNKTDYANSYYSHNSSCDNNGNALSDRIMCNRNFNERSFSKINNNSFHKDILKNNEISKNSLYGNSSNNHSKYYDELASSSSKISNNFLNRIDVQSNRKNINEQKNNNSFEKRSDSCSNCHDHSLTNFELFSLFHANVSCFFVFAFKCISSFFENALVFFLSFFYVPEETAARQQIYVLENNLHESELLVRKNEQEEKENSVYFNNIFSTSNLITFFDSSYYQNFSSYYYNHNNNYSDHVQLFSSKSNFFSNNDYYANNVHQVLPKFNLIIPHQAAAAVKQNQHSALKTESYNNNNHTISFMQECTNNKIFKRMLWNILSAVLLGFSGAIGPIIILSKVSHSKSVLRADVLGLAFGILEVTTAVFIASCNYVFAHIVDASGSYVKGLIFLLIIDSTVILIIVYILLRGVFGKTFLSIRDYCNLIADRNLIGETLRDAKKPMMDDDDDLNPESVFFFENAESVNDLCEGKKAQSSKPLTYNYNDNNHKANTYRDIYSKQRVGFAYNVLDNRIKDKRENCTIKRQKHEIDCSGAEGFDHTQDYRKTQNVEKNEQNDQPPVVKQNTLSKNTNLNDEYTNYLLTNSTINLTE